MLCLIPFCEHDRDKAVDLINWIKKLGGWGKHRLLTVAQPEIAIEGIENIGDFERVKCDWSETHKDASGVNSMFRQAAYWVYMNDRQPWLWNEPDAIWLKGGVLDRMEAEYTIAGKPYMGPIRTAAKGRKHLGGVSVYPPNLPEIGIRILGADKSPFDLVGGDEVLKTAHITNLIAQHHRHPGFKNLGELQPVIDSGAVLFHSNHDGSVIRLLSGDAWKAEAPSSEKSRDEFVRQDVAGNAVVIPEVATDVTGNTWISRVRTQVKRLSDFADTIPHKAQILAELRKSGLAPAAVSRPTRKTRPKSRQQQPSAR